MKYEPPVLVDMKGPGLCGEFVSCSTGSKPALGSCYENNDCKTGTMAEHCQNGTSACGCDSCCGIGTVFTSKSGLPCGDCSCLSGSVAYFDCTPGNYAMTLYCNDGYYANTGKCTVGTTVGGGLQQCESGT
jgi:hypothetical protein